MPRRSDAPTIRAIIASLRDVGQFMPIPDFNRRQAADALEQLLEDVSYLNSLLDNKCLEILDLHDRLKQADRKLSDMEHNHSLACAALSEQADKFKLQRDSVIRMLKNGTPVTYHFLIQWKDQTHATYGDPPYSVEIAACEDGDEVEDDLDIFFYAGYKSQQEIATEYSRDNSPEDWYILSEDQVSWCDNCGDAIEIGKERARAEMPLSTSSTGIGESAIMCPRCDHYLANNINHMEGRDVL